MSSTITRPTFYEGEILPAADLVATVEYPRDQVARHDRYLHSWGIVKGLQLTPGAPTKTVTGPQYVPVTLSAGIAIDGTGREIVVPQDTTLNRDDFRGEVEPLKDASVWYPVFVYGFDQGAQPSSNLTGACNTSQSTSTQENFAVTYGLPGSELDLETQHQLSVTDPPGNGVDSVWKVLVGFVQWSADANNFKAAQLQNDAGEAPRYVGVNASRVTSESGSVLISTHPAEFQGKNPILAVDIDETANNGQLVFGKLQSDGSVNPVLTISANGDITTQGQIRGAVLGGGVKVESGLATHGMTLPLPSGVTEDQVASGDAVVQTFVSLHLNGTENPDPNNGTFWGAFPLECYVDDQRRAHCRVRWFQLDAGNIGTNIEDRPAVCEYLVAAVSKQT